MSTIPETQKALVIEKSGAKYAVKPWPTPQPGPTDVLIKVQGTGLNPVDVAFEKYGFENFAAAWGVKSSFPLLAGMDGAGTVVKVGKDVKNLAVGDRVTFQGWVEPKLGSFQQYAVAPADFVAKIPSTMSFGEAASLPVTLVTAAFGFSLPPTGSPPGSGLGLKGFWEEGSKGLYKDQPIVVFGGSSSVGQYAVQIAAHLGFSPIITTSSAKHTDYLTGLGATHVLDRNAHDVIATILGGKPVKYIYDAVHIVLTEAELGLLAPGGKIVTIRQQSDDLKLVDGKQVVFATGSAHLGKDVGRQIFAGLSKALEKGIIKPNRVEKIPGGLNGIFVGLKRLDANQVSGYKLVVDPSETS